MPHTTVLHVCAGNQVRSPLAEHLMKAMLHDRYGSAAELLTIRSAGLVGPPGRPMQELAVAELGKRGLAVPVFTSRLIELAEAEDAALVLTASRRQRDELVATSPRRLLPKTFTWRELAWLLDGTSRHEIPGSPLLERVAALPDTARARRGHLAPVPPEMLDVADPMGRGRREYRQAAEEIEAAVSVIVGRL
ncbi:low molecular weight phosphatase family protein [Actinoplanes sp. DH11]|uniref:arsenate-mycothiol transferase ArsC n=1 Tax=Actinoplanes sp. DH11 TaxID=2857011 RepID=UPI001E618DE3|nr:hypothetical protein [Actinoplanes sp. DH11]